MKWSFILQVNNLLGGDGADGPALSPGVCGFGPDNGRTLLLFLCFCFYCFLRTGRSTPPSWKLSLFFHREECSCSRLTAEWRRRQPIRSEDPGMESARGKHWKQLILSFYLTLTQNLLNIRSPIRVMAFFFGRLLCSLAILHCTSLWINVSVKWNCRIIILFKYAYYNSFFPHVFSFVGHYYEICIIIL